MSDSRILFLITGSIAAYKACEVVSQLVQRGHTVRVAMSKAAQRFVGATTLEGLTRQHVPVDLFEAGHALDHTELTRWCDATVVCPATASSINRMAAGIGDDLVATILLAHDWAKPLLVAPAMNPRMWRHPATVDAVRRVRGWGVRIVEPGEGRTACGDAGEGRLAEPERIVAAIEAACARPLVRRRVVVTSGGTSEPVDGIRTLSNRSTGGTGALIAGRLAAAGHEVTLVRASNAVACPVVDEVLFETGDDLRHALESLLGRGGCDAVVHAAAVGDFRVESIDTGTETLAAGIGKIDSDTAPLIRLAPQPKLIRSLRSMTPGRLLVVGFKLTANATAEERTAAVERLFADSGPDFVVHNDLDDAGAGGAFPATIWSRSGGDAIRCPTREALAGAITELLSGSPVWEETGAPC